MSKVLTEPIEKYGLSKKDSPKVLFSKVGIVGCGSVGQSIARMLSRHGIDVAFIETTQEKVAEAYSGIEAQLDDMIERWGMTTGEKKAIMTRIKGTTQCVELQGCDLVIEAIKSKTREQSVEIRKKVFKNIEKYIEPSAIIATNSTTLVITELSSELEHKDRCVSLHFSSTTPDAGTIEVVRGLYTSNQAYEKVLKFVKLLNKTVIPVEESPGLISVRLIVSLINEACEILMEGVGSKENIDLAMRTGFGLPLGPFEMCDKIGLDKVLRWMDNLYGEFGDMKYKASPLIKKLVRANHLGRATGKGFYKYDENGKKIKEKSIIEK